jgi:alpha-tubulin suppressor-like RCC1 family protein
VLDERGGLFSFGSGASGALGHGDLIGQYVLICFVVFLPTILEAFQLTSLTLSSQTSHVCFEIFITQSTSTREFPVKVVEFDKIGVRIHQMSAGVDISMAITTEGTVYAWGKAADGRLGLGIGNRNITNPKKVEFSDAKFKAVDVECGYVHSLIVGLDGSVWQCGGVGTDGKEDGQQDLHNVQGKLGLPEILSGYNIWHRIPEPKEEVVKQKWEKYGKYELKGRSKMMTEGVRSIA